MHTSTHGLNDAMSDLGHMSHTVPVSSSSTVVPSASGVSVSASAVSNLYPPSPGPAGNSSSALACGDHGGEHMHIRGLQDAVSAELAGSSSAFVPCAAAVLDVDNSQGDLFSDLQDDPGIALASFFR